VKNDMSLTASYRRILHRMGYYDYQRGLIYHHLNEEGGWNDHLRNCRDFIMKSMEIVKPEVVTVLGSGWLLDLPLKEISDRADRVNLVDIIHPPEVKGQTVGIENVTLKEEDVTGGLIAEVWQKAGHRMFFNKLRTLDDIIVPAYRPDYDPGMVISLNILTQLEYMPLELLKRKSAADSESLLNFRKKVQRNHLSFLKMHKSVLITDISEVVTDSSGKVSEITSVDADLPEGVEREEWTWLFEHRRPDYYRKKSIYRVAAILSDNEQGGYQKKISRDKGSE